MTNAELADLRGEIFGLKVLLFNVLSAITANSLDPVATIEAVKTQVTRWNTGRSTFIDTPSAPRGLPECSCRYSRPSC